MKEGIKIFPVFILGCFLSLQWFEYVKSVDEMAKSRWHTFMSATYFSRKDETTALKELQKALETKAVYPDAYMKMGIYYLNRNENEEAIKFLLSAFKYYPSSKEVCLFLARAYEGTGNLGEALKWAEYCVNLKKEKTTILLLANFYLKGGLERRAFNLLEEFKDTDDPEILLLYGLSAFRTGKKEIAQKIFERLLSSPNIPDSLKKLIKEKIEK
mgnify:CR=1 FL=1